MYTYTLWMLGVATYRSQGYTTADGGLKTQVFALGDVSLAIRALGLDILSHHPLDIISPHGLGRDELVIGHKGYHLMDTTLVKLLGHHLARCLPSPRHGIDSISYNKRSRWAGVYLNDYTLYHPEGGRHDLRNHGVLELRGLGSRQPRPTTNVRNSRASGKTKP